MPGALSPEETLDCETVAVTKHTNGFNGTHTAHKNKNPELNDSGCGAEKFSDEQNTSRTESIDQEPERQKCEVQFYEARYDARGERELKVLDAEKANKKDVDSEDEKRKYALCSQKWYGRNGEIESASVEIMSPHIILALQKIINEYPDEHFWSDMITMDSPYKPVFHYREELAAYSKSLVDEEAAAHVNLLLTFCEKENRRAIAEYEANVKNAIDKPSIRWSNLWMVYKPGELLITGGGPSLQCREVVNSWERGGQCPAWVVLAKVFTHDGTRFGHEELEVGQSPYKGMKELSKLRCIP